MSQQITEAYKREYKSNVELLLQTMGSQLRGSVSEDSYTGEGGRPVNQIGAVAATKRTTRHGDTEYTDTPHASRWVEPNVYDWSDLIDSPDKLKSVFDPQGPYAKSGALAIGRAQDAEIVSAFFATSKTGPQGASTEAFSATYQVAVGTTGMTVAKLRAGRKLLMAAKNRLDGSDKAHVAVTANEHDNLLNEPQVVSGDYNRTLVLVEGKIQRFLGFEFIHLEELTLDGSGNTLCPMWVKSGMHFGVWNDLQTEIDRLPGKKYSTQVFVSGMFGATRTQQGKVVQIACVRT